MFRPLRRLPGKSRFASLLGVTLILGLIISQVTPAIQPVRAVPAMHPQNSEVIWTDEASPPGEPSGGLQLELSEGVEQAGPVEQIPLAPAEPLSADKTQAILDRLPPLAVEAEDTAEFRLPPESLPPPRPGATVDQPFPPEEDAAPPPAAETGPLEVLRFAPEGEIPLAPFLNVTFSQPMVPLATLEELAALDVPVTLTPALPGVWKWIGTKTLSFEYSDEAGERFPMATEYVAEIPAGVESATGGVLAEPVRWTFTTPPPTLTNRLPGSGPQPRDPLLFAAFDQRIDPAAVLETVQVSAAGRIYPVRLATDEEIAADSAVRKLAERAGEGRWLAFRADEPFPADTTVAVNFGPGTPSAEGPLTTSGVQSFSFQTYAPLRIDSHRCGYGYEPTDCPPLTPFEIHFNNTIDAEHFDEALLTVEPAIPGLIVENFGSTIRLRGATAGRTEYTVTVDGDIRDVFGQTLGEDHALTFTTGAAPQALVGPNANFITLDPSSQKPLFTFYSVNYARLRIQAYAVTPQDWPAYMTYLREFDYTEDAPEPPGEKVMSKVFTVQGEDDSLTETSIDLTPALGGQTGHLIVVVDRPTFAFLNRGRRDIIQTWVQVTQIGLDAYVDHSEMTAWASSLVDGEPLPDVQIELGGSSAVTAEDGIAKFELSAQPASLLIARLGDDVAFLPQSQYYWYEDGWRKQPVRDEVRWHVFDDRAMYRPGEEVHMKGWVRRIGAKQDGDVALLRGATTVWYQVSDMVGNQIDTGVVDVSELGGFDLAVTLPDNAALGYAQVNLQLVEAGDFESTEYYHAFQIQEFRRPEFEVTARPEGEGPYFVGGEATVGVHAAYFAGGPLPNADANWNITAQPGSYAPPNWPEFTFGTWTPWWRYGGWDDGQPRWAMASESYQGVTDASGAHILRIGFTSAAEPRPYSVRAEAVVMDVNRQAWASSANLLVHPADLYVGLRSARTFVEAGDPLVIDAIVTDLDGNPVADRPIALRAVRLEWKYENGEWRENEADAQECTAGSLDEPVSCTFTTEIGGEYRITATIQDSMGRANRSELTRWVSGGQRPPARTVEQEEALLIPDKETYQPGDVAEIMVQTPFVPADGLLSLRRNGIVSTEHFHMNEPTHVLRVPIEDAYIPNLHIAVDLAGSAPRVDDDGNPQPDLPARPAYASGSLNLSIPPLSRELALTVEPEHKELEPGARTSLAVAVTDADGAPVADAELAVVIVDEAILALTGYNLSDPLATFYRNRPDGVSSYYGRSNIVLINPGDLADQLESKMMDEAVAEMAAPMPTMAAGMAEADGAMMLNAMPMEEEAAMERGLGGGPAEEGAPIAMRTDFNPLAVFAPAVRTDAAGQAVVDVKLPDNLTRYRVMVTAVAGEKLFGAAESNITARLPLMVRPSAPRFLNFGDGFELPIVVQNQTDEPLQIEIALRTANLDLTDAAGRSVEIPANDRREVRFPAAALSAGTARVQIAAVSGELADAAAVELPVYTPATAEAFAVYGVVDEGAVAQPVRSPQGVFPQFGGLEINTSSTALQALTDAVIYLVNYPFECSEQIASRILGLAALRDVLTAFEAEELPPPEQLQASVERDIARLQQFQNNDGGFPIWTRGRESIPYHSIHVAHALQRARLMDYAVPDEMLQRSLDYLRNIESYFPSWYGTQTRHALSAYALYVRDLIGDVDAPKARNLLNSRALDDQSLEAIAWLWQVLSGDPASAAEVENIRRHVNNRAVETAGAANFVTSYGDDAYLMLHSNRRTDAVVLDALINDSPDSDLIPKVVNGLLAHRTAGRWNNTQENVFILLALDRYFNTYEAVTPDFVARMWLGETYVAAHEYAGRTTERQSTTVPMSVLVEGSESSAEEGALRDLIIEKDGEGRLYYRLGLRYAPQDLDLDPLDMGFTVQRTYAAVDDPDDVTRDEDGVWRIKAGARVRITVDLVANSRRYHVALIDPLPAGLESINPALAVSEDVPAGDPAQASPRWWWWGPWYEHQNLRDARAEAFTSLLWEGVYQYSYVARATTPGSYVVPPARAEEMYSPEVFGRSATDRVIVE